MSVAIARARSQPSHETAVSQVEYFLKTHARVLLAVLLSPGMYVLVCVLCTLAASTQTAV
jgi:hypothetical protein